MSVKKIATWIALSSAESALLYFGMFQRVGWCWNLLRFALWVLVVITVLSSLWVSDKATEPDFDTEQFLRSVPGWVSATFDCAIAGTLAAFGHFGYAAIVVTQQLFEASLYSAVDKARAKKAAHA